MKGRISIHFVNTLQEDGGAYIEIEEEISGSTFLRLEISPDQLARGLMGLSGRPVEFQLNHLDRLGKKKVLEKIRVKLPELGPSQDRREVAQALLKKETQKRIKKTGKPWQVELLLRSRDSFVYDEKGATFVQTHIYYWE